MKWRTGDGGWNPYLAGALAGALAIGSAFATTQILDRTSFLGASTTFVRAAGYVERLVSPERVEESVYYGRVAPRIDWQFMVVTGIFAGALVASLTGRSFALENTPPIWRERYGPSIGKRALAAFVGGVVAMVGVRLADGCPSGHGLSGVMMLSVSGFVALALFFGVGIVVARLLYGRSSS